MALLVEDAQRLGNVITFGSRSMVGIMIRLAAGVSKVVGSGSHSDRCAILVIAAVFLLTGENTAAQSAAGPAFEFVSIPAQCSWRGGSRGARAAWRAV